MHRKQLVAVGKWVWIERCLSYELPEGLQDGLRVVITAIDPAAHKVTVQAEDSQEWEIDPIHLDTGWQFLIGGKLFGENSPIARAYLKALISQLREEPPHPRFPELRDEKIAQWQAILNRNGCRPLALAA